MSQVESNPIASSCERLQVAAAANDVTIDKMSFISGALFVYQAMLDIGEQPVAVACENLAVFDDEVSLLGGTVERHISGITTQ